jgi:hypothetical protein
LLKKLILTTLLLAFGIPGSIQAQTEMDCKKLDSIFGKNAVQAENGICAVEILRSELNLTHMGKKMSAESMDVAFHASFEKVDTGTAVMGEFALLEDEVNPVIDELRKGGLEISALHNHMLYERPRIMFVHYQGIGDMTEQANTIKSAIEKTRH